MLQLIRETMYPLDRRRRLLASHTYYLFQSLRKAAIVLQVSHTTVSRWLRNPEKAIYPKRRYVDSKSMKVTDTIRLAIQSNPFVSLFSLKNIMKEVLSLDVSKELLRTVIKTNGYSKKKAKFFSEPKKWRTKPKLSLKRGTG